jgi:hypothetical protein
VTVGAVVTAGTGALFETCMFFICSGVIGGIFPAWAVCVRKPAFEIKVSVKRIEMNFFPDTVLELIFIFFTFLEFRIDGVGWI